jgi:hypothetical protein
MPSRLARGLVAAALLLAVSQLAVQNWRANFRYPADPRNPYVYAHTVPDFLRLSQRVIDIAALHPDRSGMLVRVIAGPYEQWPIPWYLRGMTRVGYWLSAADAGRFDDAPIVVAAKDQADAPSARRSGTATCRSSTGCGRRSCSPSSSSAPPGTGSSRRDRGRTNQESARGLEPCVSFSALRARPWRY